MEGCHHVEHDGALISYRNPPKLVVTYGTYSLKTQLIVNKDGINIIIHSSTVAEDFRKGTS